LQDRHSLLRQGDRRQLPSRQGLILSAIRRDDQPGNSFNSGENQMTEAQAKYLAASEPDYRAKKMRGEWVVWCDASDHVVEFDNIVLAHAARLTGETK
jgi:hypothetical protein